MLRLMLIGPFSVGLAVHAGCSEGSPCGPTTATVVNVVDGDTIDLDTGLRVRYLMVDSPELSSGDCYALEAKKLNTQLVLGREVTLRYDAECEDRFGRTLAYIYVDDTEINRLMVERGYACQLHIGPNGDDRVDEFIGLETQARNEGRGMWGQCPVVACD